MSQVGEIEVAFPARPGSCPKLRRGIRTFLERLRIDGGRVDDVVLAVGEAAGHPSNMRMGATTVP